MLNDVLPCTLCYAHHTVPLPPHHLAHVPRQRLQLKLDLWDEAHIHHTCAPTPLLTPAFLFFTNGNETVGGGGVLQVTMTN